MNTVSFLAAKDALIMSKHWIHEDLRPQQFGR